MVLVLFFVIGGNVAGVLLLFYFLLYFIEIVNLAHRKKEREYSLPEYPLYDVDACWIFREYPVWYNVIFIFLYLVI